MTRFATRLASLAGLALVFLLVLAPAARAEKVNQSFLGTAVGGADVVAYFEDGKPRAGSREFTHEWRGATWRFATEEHRALFAADPEQYAPQYGGFCAYAVSHGALADIDPEAWRIVDGKLYLNLSKDVQKLWEADVPGHISRADANWPRLSSD